MAKLFYCHEILQDEENPELSSEIQKTVDFDYIMLSNWLGGYRWFPCLCNPPVKKRELPVSNAL